MQMQWSSGVQHCTYINWVWPGRHCIICVTPKGNVPIFCGKPLLVAESNVSIKYEKTKTCADINLPAYPECDPMI